MEVREKDLKLKPALFLCPSTTKDYQIIGGFNLKVLMLIKAGVFH